jgi:hypothetical protein
MPCSLVQFWTYQLKTAYPDSRTFTCANAHPTIGQGSIENTSNQQMDEVPMAYNQKVNNKNSMVADHIISTLYITYRCLLRYIYCQRKAQLAIVF